jgi:hypothetical protein
MSDPVGYQGPPTALQNAGSAIGYTVANLPLVKRLAAALRTQPTQGGTQASGQVGADFDARTQRAISDAGG